MGITTTLAARARSDIECLGIKNGLVGPISIFRWFCIPDVPEVTQERLHGDAQAVHASMLFAPVWVCERRVRAPVSVDFAVDTVRFSFARLGLASGDPLRIDEPHGYLVDQGVALAREWVFDPLLF